MIEPQAQQRDIKLTFFPISTNTWFANADRTRVKQVLITCFPMRSKYNREHGTVEVKWYAYPRNAYTSASKIAGTGLPPEKLAQAISTVQSSRARERHRGRTGIA